MAFSVPVLQFPPSLTFPLSAETDSREMEYLFSMMQAELARYQGRPMDLKLSIEMAATITRWQARLDRFVPGIRFTSSVKGDGWVQITGYIPPQYVLVVRPEVPF
jgi:hypothetical protein